MRSIIKLTILATALASCSGVHTNNKDTSSEIEKVENIKQEENKQAEEEFNAYWHNGKAEISSYKLSQARYGEIHEGNSVMIFVTEQFLPKKQVKADSYSKENTPVLKLNTTKNYLTGIYPYSIMSSVFTPIQSNSKAIKTTFSAQEWCGQTYIQLNNRNSYEVESHSYFERNGDLELKLDKDYLENDIWTAIRISPSTLPLGKLKMIPSLEFFGMQHQEVKAYDATATLETKENLNLYTIDYPELGRTLTIKYTKEFPYVIEGWEEVYASRFLPKGTSLTSTAERMKSIRSDYWTKNKAKDTVLRKELGL